MMVTTGVDIIDLDEINQTLHDPRQLQRILQAGDIESSTAESVAGRIALKEAAIKALGLAAGDWLKLTIGTAQSGKPLVRPTDPIRGLISLDGSISHHGNTVIGFVVALFDDEKSQEIVQDDRHP